MSCEIVVEDFSNGRLSKLHLLPCKIDCDGGANVESYFKSTIKEEDGANVATLRGRPLRGDTIKVPDGYIGCVMKEPKKSFSEDEDRRFKIASTFNEFTYWNLENQPSVNDKVQKAMLWTRIAEAIHNRESVNK